MLAGMADGSVRFVSKDIDPAVLEQLATIHGGGRPAIALPEARPNMLAQTAPPAVVKPAGPASTGDEKPRPKASPAEPKPGGGQRPGPPAPAAMDVADEEAPGEVRRVDPAARLADRFPEIRFDATPLVDAIRLISQMSTLPITFDLDAMAEVGAALRDPVTLTVTDGSVADVLQSVLAARKLIFVIENEQVLVTSPQRGRAALRPERYDLADLAATPGAASDLAHWVRRLVVPEAWRDAGGPGTVAVVAGGLEVMQTDAVHYQLKRFFEKLRKARQSGTAGLADRPELATRFDKVRSRLRQSVTATFPEPTRLVHILADLEAVGGVTIVADWIALAEAGVPADAKATLKVHGRPLSEAIVELLQPLGLTYRFAGPEVLEITSRKAVAGRLEIEFYPVGTLLAKGVTAEAIINRIKGEVAGATWSDAGGPGQIYFDKPSACLVVLQSQPVQVKTQLLLGRLASEAAAR
jgi:hypothetical protein